MLPLLNSNSHTLDVLALHFCAKSHHKFSSSKQQCIYYLILFMGHRSRAGFYKAVNRMLAGAEFFSGGSTRRNPFTNSLKSFGRFHVVTTGWLRSWLAFLLPAGWWLISGVGVCLFFPLPCKFLLSLQDKLAMCTSQTKP